MDELSGIAGVHLIKLVKKVDDAIRTQWSPPNAHLAELSTMIDPETMRTNKNEKQERLYVGFGRKDGHTIIRSAVLDF